MARSRFRKLQKKKQDEWEKEQSARAAAADHAEKSRLLQEKQRQEERKRVEKEKIYEEVRKLAEEESAKENETKMKDLVASLISEFTGENRDKSQQDDLCALLKNLEITKLSPLCSSDEDFPKQNITYISEPGLHVGFCLTTLDIRFQVRITSLKDLKPELYTQFNDVSQILMDYTSVVPKITNNGAGSLKKRTLKSHEKEVTPAANKRYGQMHAAGWHGTRGEPNADISYYAPSQSSKGEQQAKLIAKYEELVLKMPQVHDAYAAGLQRLYPMGYAKMENFAAQNEMPSFAHIKVPDTEDTYRAAIANSITITLRDFANYQHQDKDAVPVVYGWWWVAVQNGEEWVVDPKFDHKDVEGGEFLFGEYGFAVDFERTSGLVEIMWRGCHDQHGTMKSTSPANVTRFGTSIQLTSSAVAGLKRWKERGSSSTRIKNVFDRVAAANKALKKKH
ncbi:hypothetical protein K435DRAFT_797326 [Dendrothele bispora CBS 962.96]|uniref:Tet-like 2OG-Fe(II) oxygenase domain-containing protein n=1 Tax=Dendrothele bispora (strain CBS 962.96) TaxID=1314807 RepID=A0A4S8M2T6_DENBC|nr:hypothetical protein K435DRAFT_797326 [Dendrothele bispora CBS 962.96]